MNESTSFNQGTRSCPKSVQNIGDSLQFKLLLILRILHLWMELFPQYVKELSCLQFSIDCYQAGNLHLLGFVSRLEWQCSALCAVSKACNTCMYMTLLLPEAVVIMEDNYYYDSTYCMVMPYLWAASLICFNHISPRSN